MTLSLQSSKKPKHFKIMRNLSLLFVMLFVSQFLSAQKVIENPSYAYSTAGGLQITKIELTDSSTICHFVYSNGPGAGFFIPSGSYIRPDDTPNRLFVVKADNVPLDNGANVPSSGKAEYALYFPPISKATKMLEFGEGNEGGNWFIYEIELEKKPYKGAMTQNLSGYWYKTDGSKELVVAFYDTVALYKNQLWKYGKVTQLKKQYSIELTSGSANQTLMVKPIDSLAVLLETSKKEQLKLCNSPKEVKGYSNPNDKPYTAPVFVKDGQATYKGFIRNFNPKYVAQKTGQIHVNNVITGNQKSYTVKIANDGTFSITFPMAYPCQIYAQMPMVYEAVYVEPGMETFHIIDISQPEKNLFMGELASINSCLMAVKNIRHFDYEKIQDSILTLSPAQYRDYCFQVRDLDLNELNAYADSHSLTSKVMQIKRTSINYSAASNAMEYDWKYENTYRKKNNIPREQRELGVEIPQPDSLFYTFLNNSMANDPLAVVSNDYDSFINRLKYLDILRSNSTYSFTIPNIIAAAKEEGISFTPDEEKMIAKQLSIKSDTVLDRKMEGIFNKHQATVSSFFRKNQAAIQELSKNESFVIYYDIEDSLKKRGVEVTEKEVEFLKEICALKTRDQFVAQAKESKAFMKENGEALNAFHAKYDDIVREQAEKKRNNYRDEKMKQLFGIEKGLASDIMYAQDLCRGIVEEASPMETEALKRKLKSISTPFIAEYVISQNEQTKAQLETNKLKTGYAVNIAPNVEADKLFDAMLEKFKGKVVFVDFWATWCGPCRSGIERIKPLKEEMEGKDIVFLYITGPSSPEGTWNNMIPDIKGEHYRVNADEWNTICGKFNISGIPHYALVDKNGMVAKNDGMPEYDLNAMKKMFEEFMAK
jgi:thiol-disulfide isomerase/thioredoxin